MADLLLLIPRRQHGLVRLGPCRRLSGISKIGRSKPILLFTFVATQRFILYIAHAIIEVEFRRTHRFTRLNLLFYKDVSHAARLDDYIVLLDQLPITADQTQVKWTDGERGLF